MPFISRRVKPIKLKRLAKKETLIHDDFDDVSNYTLAGVLLQLASISQQAEDLFGGISEEMLIIYRRCTKISTRITEVQNLVEKLDPKSETVPISDLETEKGIPLYFHYQSPNSIEEDLFTRDTRTPCVIHLHQKARQDINYILRGSDAYAKQGRPKSLDPRLLMEECDCPGFNPYSPRSPRNSSFFSASSHITPNSKNDISSISAHDNMRLETSDANIDIITVDTSGAKFDRQANLRRSQRISSCSVRQRANLANRRQLRHRHKTLTGLPGNISSELGDPNTPRPYSLHSEANNSTGVATGSSFVDGSSDESRSLVNGHAVVSPRHNQKSVEIQTDEVRVIPLSPAQRRMRFKGKSRSSNVSPSSSHASTELFESPTAVPCPSVPQKNQTSTPISKDKNMIRPKTLDVKEDNDTSTDEGRHTGESNPPTPVHNGRKNNTSSSPDLKASPSSPMATKCQQNGIPEKGQDISLRVNGARVQQNEERTSSGVWSGTESTRHSSTSDIMTQHAQVTNALQQMMQDRLRSPVSSPILSKSAGQSPLVENRPWPSTSAASSSSVSINSHLSTLEGTKSKSSASMRDDDDLYPSANSSVISVTINRSTHSKSNLSLGSSTDGGTALSAKAMLKKSRKGRHDASAGVYNFMNYEIDPLETDADALSRAVKSRRSARGSKPRSTRRPAGEDTVSMASMADSSCLLTDGSNHSGATTNDSASLCESTFSVDQEGYYTSMHDDCGIAKSASPEKTSVSPATNSMSSMAESLPPDFPPPDIPDSAKTITPTSPKPSKVTSPTAKSGPQAFFGEKFDKKEKKDDYSSYQRAVKSNHSTPKTLLSGRGKSASVKVQSSSPAVDFQSELNKRLSLRRAESARSAKSPMKKEKRGAPPPPPRRTSSLSSSAASSPALSHKSYSEKSPIPASPLLSSSRPSSTKSPVPPMTKIEEGLPPPPTPEQLADMTSEVFKDNSPQPSPLSPPSEKSKPPTANKPQLSLSAKQAPGTKPKPFHHVAPPTKVKSPLAKSVAAENAKAVVTKETTVVQTTVEVKSNDSTKPTGKENLEIDPNKQTKKVEEKIPEIKIQSSTVAPVDVPDGKAAPSSEVTKKTDDVTKGVTPKVTEVKTPPPVKAKFASVKAPTNKVPPVISPKPVTSPKSTDVTNTSFDQKRNREQSPSYRASLARAAFFGQSTSSHPSDDVRQERSDSNVQDTKSEDQKVDINKSEGISEEKKQTVSVTVATNVSEETIKRSETVQVSNQTSTKAISKETDENVPTRDEEKEPKESVETTESIDYLGKIEEFSAPNRAPKPDVTSPNGSAAERLLTTSQSPSSSAASRLLHSDKETTKASPKFSTYDNLMAVIHKSKRETLSGKPSSSPPSSPTTNNDVFTFRTSSNGNHSPVSTLERKRNGRLSSNGHRNAISRKSTGGTSRDDFKALLLQNACRTSSGSQMSAAEKLLLKKPQGGTSAPPKQQRPHSVHTTSSLTNGTAEEGEDTTDGGKPILSLSDIRSAITSNQTSGRQGRPVRRGNKSSGLDTTTAKKSATLSLHGKKHPPPSLSSKYNTRSRTPTRPMMSISEDSETEKSPEQAREKARIAER